MPLERSAKSRHKDVIMYIMEINIRVYFEVPQQIVYNLTSSNTNEKPDLCHISHLMKR